MLTKRKPRVQSPAARKAALRGQPHRLHAVKKEEKDGKLYVTVEFNRPGWQRLLGGEGLCERTFGLDAYGRRVYESCDGKATVQEIIKSFARANRISIPEAELAVTKFMQTLMAKGLVAMQMEKDI